MLVGILNVATQELEVPGQKYCFQLVGKDDVTVLLHAESENEMLEWIGSLRYGTYEFPAEASALS